MYQIVTIEPDWILEDEPMGTKDKYWVLLPNDDIPWLFKYSRKISKQPVSIAGEHWSEKVASEIGGILGIPCAKVELAEFKGIYGSISQKFEELQNSSCELVHGNELLAGAIENYDQEKKYGHSLHTFENILTAIRAVTNINGEQARRDAYHAIGGYILLDALIMNVDRHHENWSMFRKYAQGQTSHEMAPSFDHASSVGRELESRKISIWKQQGDKSYSKQIDKYIDKGRGGVFEEVDSQKGMNPIELVQLANRRWPSVISPWLKKLSETDIDALCETLRLVPITCTNSYSLEFAELLLRKTYGRLLEI